MIEYDKELARARSTQDAADSNRYARAAAQLSILINGGAATAILAYLSNIVTNTSAILRAAPYALGFYAFGVVFGALMMFFLARSVEDYAELWALRASGKEPTQKMADRRCIVAYRCFGLSIACFAGASSVMAISLMLG
jgi:hypothetical protein